MSDGVDYFETDKLARLLARKTGSARSEPVAREIIRTGRSVAKLTPADIDHALASSVAQVMPVALQTGLEKLSDASDTPLTPQEFIALESVVMLDGIRPSVRFQDQQLKWADVTLGEWETVTQSASADIEIVAKSVGRINLASRQMGTGFMVSDTLLMTNRHVLQGIGHWDGLGWSINPDVTVDFSDQGINTRGHYLSGRIIASTQEIDATALDFSKSDYALLELGGADLPPALMLEESISDVITSRPVYTIGYPGKPMPGAERFSLLKDIFDFDFGIKRFAPGEVEQNLSAFAQHGSTSVFGHDCTTLGGCSGSPIVDLGDTNARVVGVHFSGLKRVSNYAHSLAALRPELDDQDLNYAT